MQSTCLDLDIANVYPNVKTAVSVRHSGAVLHSDLLQ